MAQSFSLSSQRCALTSDPTLREEIDGHTLSPDATSKILRSIDRFGRDASIQRFEMTPTKHQARFGKNELAWTVRAVRSEPGPTSI